MIRQEVEVTELFKKGYTPIEIAIMKWEKILSDVNNHNKIEVKELYSTNYPLCFFYRKYAIFHIDIFCFKCPLDKIGEGCEESNSFWRNIKYNIKNNNYKKSHLLIKALIPQ